MANGKSIQLAASEGSAGTKISAVDSNAQVRKAFFTYTSASNVDTDVITLTKELPVGAKITGYCVITSGTAAGAGVTLDLGITGSATAIAADLDIAANGTDAGTVLVNAGGKAVIATYDNANPADGNVINGWVEFSVL